MRLERLSESQIRCTLSKIDLHSRKMDLHELTYGSENARNLFCEMIQQASIELDFHVEDIPLMVEAIPISNEGVILLITKIEDPEELDTRFSKFTPTQEENHIEGNDYVSFTKEIKRESEVSEEDYWPVYNKQSTTSTNNTEHLDMNTNLSCVFLFPNLDTVSKVAEAVKDVYQGENTLYKSDGETGYYLLLNKSFHTSIEFNRVCNIVSEYGQKLKSSLAHLAYFEEHYIILIRESALQILANL
ncbi:hypothetical protein FACS189418_4040 [Clostridia bacterium]|nr:hypothetical protein FACS189418_4040 [Clostridia bacterium]